MESLAPEGPQRAGDSRVAGRPAVQRIAHDRAAEMRQVDADLMGPTGVQPRSHEAGRGLKRRPEAAFDPVLGDPRPAAGAAYRHTLAVGRMATDGGLDCAGLLLGSTPHQSLIDAGEVVSCKQPCQGLVR